MPNELKIVIDADVQKAVKGVQDVSKVIAGDFTKATQLAATAAFDLDKSVAAATQKINASIDKMVDDALSDSGRLKSSFSNIGEGIANAFNKLPGGILIPPIPPVVVRSINELERELDELRTKIDFSKDVNEIKRLGDEFRKVEGQINNIKVAGNLSTQLDRIGLAGKRAADNLKSVPKSSNAATYSLINLGRVVQDAPFGIIGIANNINPLLESFQRLKAESASTGAAFKAFGASLLGGGGIGLGVSVVTSLLTQFALSNRSSAEENNKWAKAIQNNADAVRAKQDEFKASLDKASASLLNQTDKLQDLNKILVTTATNIDSITDATIRQGVAQFIFDKKNLELQKLLNAEIQKQLRARKQADIRTTVPEFDPGVISKDPLERQAADARQTLGTLNFLGFGLENFFKNFVKTSDNLKKEQDETISSARKFVKDFGGAFVLPGLEDTFFTKKEDLFKASQKVLSDAKKFIQGDIRALQVKLPVNVTTETKVNAEDLQKFLRDEIKLTDIRSQKIVVPIVTDLDIQLAESLAKEFEPTKGLIDGFFSSLKIEKGIPLTVGFDPTLDKANIDAINKKLDLRKQFSIFGDLGLAEFNKIDFSNINKGIEEATKRFQGMMAIATTLNQAIGQGMVSAFNSVFDAILEGKNVFKALGQALKELVVNTIKAVAQMLILKAITNLIFHGAGSAGSLIGRSLLGSAIGGTANFGTGGIGGTAFSNIIQIVGQSSVSGDQIITVYERATNSQRRF